MNLSTHVTYPNWSAKLRLHQPDDHPEYIIYVLKDDRDYRVGWVELDDYEWAWYSMNEEYLNGEIRSSILAWVHSLPVTTCVYLPLPQSIKGSIFTMEYHLDKDNEPAYYLMYHATHVATFFDLGSFYPSVSTNNCSVYIDLILEAVRLIKKAINSASEQLRSIQ